MLSKIFKGLIVSSIVTLSGCSLTSSDDNQESVDYFADNGTGNPLAIVQTPAGEHKNGITYVSYQGPFEDPYVAAYNHDTQNWEGPFRAGTSELGRRAERTKFDNHGKPTLLIDDLGYIHIFYGGHGGDKFHGDNLLGNVHHGANKHSISKRPFDITEWEEVDNISVFGTYNQALKMDNGDIYLFYRHGAHRSDWVYQVSKDHGRTFTDPVSYLKHKRRSDIGAVDSWYSWATHGNGDDIIISFDYHVCWDGKSAPDHRGHTTQRHDAHFMTFDTKENTWRNVEGNDLTMPLTREEAEKNTLAYDTGEQWTFNGSTRLDSNGHPHIAINVGVDQGLKTGGPKHTRHLRWNGDEWLGGESVNGKNTGTSRGDFLVDGPMDVNFILTDNDGTDGVVANWKSVDGGKSFSKTAELLRLPNSSFAITALIKNAHPDAQVIVGQKEKGVSDRKIFLIGQNGPITRPLKNATLTKDSSKFAK